MYGSSYKSDFIIFPDKDTALLFIFVNTGSRYFKKNKQKHSKVGMGCYFLVNYLCISIEMIYYKTQK
ncbi:hypothetical protein AGMMS50239_21840 [Bacteroidia bacterium]|nr:hypothetical protein AGMMS50239_21840 [Bacteroidia bacterium]